MRLGRKQQRFVRSGDLTCSDHLLELTELQLEADQDARLSQLLDFSKQERSLSPIALS
ncbi:MAG: hypothetical protein KME10_14225 [Plectolyngbya sp. WJT66-NPBG17]|nr:hypothetical protein [Plectolyngbya sp. WJT66-NPBG17]